MSRFLLVGAALLFTTFTLVGCAAGQTATPAPVLAAPAPVPETAAPLLSDHPLSLLPASLRAITAAEPQPGPTMQNLYTQQRMQAEQYSSTSLNPAGTSGQ
jgi:hypothetical protein